MSSQALARAASSRPRLSARLASGSTSLVSPREVASACNSAGGRPRLDPGKSVKRIVEARPPSSATKPWASLSAARATIATHGPERSGVSARSRSTAPMLKGTCAPSMTTGRRLGPTSTSKRSMRPGRRAAARASPSRSAAPTGSPERPLTPLRRSSPRTAAAIAKLICSIGAEGSTRVRFTREPSSSARL